MNHLKCNKCSSAVDKISFEGSDVYICPLCGEIVSRELKEVVEVKKNNIAKGFETLIALQKATEKTNKHKELNFKLFDAVHMKAESGCSESQYLLATMYQEGREINKSDNLSAQWYLLAAEGGHLKAQYKIGCCYYDGSGVPINHLIAKRWFSLAANSGHLQARRRLDDLSNNKRDINPSEKENKIAPKEDKTNLRTNLWEVFKRQARSNKENVDKSASPQKEEGINKKIVSDIVPPIHSHDNEHERVNHGEDASKRNFLGTINDNVKENETSDYETNESDIDKAGEGVANPNILHVQNKVCEDVNTDKFERETIDNNNECSVTNDNRLQLNILDRKVADVVNDSVVPVRLTNGINNAVSQRRVSFVTVRDFLSKEKQSEKELIDIKNFGRKSLNDLRVLLRRLNAYEAFSQAESLEKKALKKDKNLEKSILKLVNENNVSVRLFNCVNEAYRNGLLSFFSVYDYKEKSSIAQSELSALNNFGKNCLGELDILIDNYIDGCCQELEIQDNDERLNKDILELVNENQTSNRLSSRINEAYRNNLLSFVSIYDYKTDRTTAQRELSSLSNFGKTCLNELDCLVNNFIDGRNEQLTETISVEYLIDRISTFTKERNFEVFIMRRGLFGVSKHTLAEAAERHDLTRERVRQIEKKIINKCKVKANQIYFEKFLAQRKDALERFVFSGAPIVNESSASNRFKKFDSIDALSIEIVHTDIVGWLSCNYSKHEDHWVVDPLAVANISFSSDDFFELNNECKIEIRKKSESLHWPVNITKVLEAFPYINQDDIIDYFTDELDAIIDNGFIVKQNKLSSKPRLIYVLRRAGHGLHTSQIRARHKDMFGFDISEHALSAVLGRLEEALIVDRGVYDIYENLNLSRDDLAKIRERSLNFLKCQSEYVSAKIIYSSVFSSDTHKFGTEFSDYMLLGILQDDERFSVRRGLMVGIAGSEVEKNYVSLFDQVTQIVIDYGPVSIADISEKMKDTRKLYSTNIAVVFNTSPEIVSTKEYGLYDLTERVLGTEEEIFYLDIALELALLDSAKSSHVLEASLRTVGIICDKKVIKSWVSKSSRYEILGDIVKLNSPSDEVLLYNNAYQNLLNQGLSNKELFDELKNELEGKEEQQFILYDCRRNQNNEGSQSSGDIIDSMFKEFNF